MCWDVFYASSFNQELTAAFMSNSQGIGILHKTQRRKKAVARDVSRQATQVHLGWTGVVECYVTSTACNSNGTSGRVFLFTCGSYNWQREYLEAVMLLWSNRLPPTGMCLYEIKEYDEMNSCSNCLSCQSYGPSVLSMLFDTVALQDLRLNFHRYTLLEMSRSSAFKPYDLLR